MCDEYEGTEIIVGTCSGCSGSGEEHFYCDRLKGKGIEKWLLK